MHGYTEKLFENAPICRKTMDMPLNRSIMLGYCSKTVQRKLKLLQLTGTPYEVIKLFQLCLITL